MQLKINLELKTVSSCHYLKKYLRLVIKVCHL